MFSIFVILFLYIKFTVGGILNFQSSINSEEKTQIFALTQGEATKGILVNFEVAFRGCPQDCSPVLFFYTDGTQEEGMKVRKQCFPSYGSFTFHQFYYSVTESRSQCENSPSANSQDLTCKGSRKFYLNEKRFWFVQFGYECGKKRSLGLHFNMTVQTDLVPVCKKFDHDKCGISGQYVALPNVFGIHEQGQALITSRNLDLFPSIQDGLCYQHIDKFFCLSLFPLCDEETAVYGYQASTNSVRPTRAEDGSQRGGTYVVPCKQMCYDAKFGCSQEQRKINFIAIADCEIYPDGTLPGADCFYEPVVCPPPTAFPNTTVQHGNISYINQTANYICDEGSFPKDGVSESVCLPTGQWSLQDLSCKISDEVPPIKGHYFALLALPCGAIIVLVIACIALRHYQYSLGLIKDYYCCPPKGTQQLSPEIFLCFSSLDRERADTFKEELRRNVPECTVITYIEDFCPSRRIMDCVLEGVWRSYAVVFYLSQNFVNSQWCEFEFKEADKRRRHEPDFRLFVVLAEDVNDTGKLQNVPESIRPYLSTYIYLWLHDNNFWTRLRQALLGRVL